MFSEKKTCDVMLMPINKEVIDAAINCKAHIENLPLNESIALSSRNYKEYLEGGKVGFINIADINRMDKESKVYFDSFK